MSPINTALRVFSAEQPDDRKEWLAVWQRWPEREVFAHPDYVLLFARPGWQARCACLETECGTVLYPFVLRDLTAEPFWRPSLGPAADITTPYGYGGPWFWGPGPSDVVATSFWEQFDDWAYENDVVSEFVRFSLFADQLLAYPGQMRRDRDNVVRDLRPAEAELWMDFKHKVRKNVKRAQREGIRIEVDDAGRRIDEFLRIYRKTMDRRQAGRNYYFGAEFFDRIRRRLKGQFAFFHALRDGHLVSTELVLVSARSVYSFLGGTDEEAFAWRPNDLIKYEIIRWAKSQGKTWFVLGGGYQPDDGIFRYKLSFAPRGIVPFRVGLRVLRPVAYERLCQARRRQAAAERRLWKPDPDFFPAYRSEAEDVREDQNTAPSEATGQAADFAPWPVFGAEEIEAVAGVLRSGRVNYWTGDQVRRFEEEFAAAVGCPYGVAVANGTVALELALYALGIGPGDEVVVPARSFVASASCCLLRGAVPVFADVDPDSQNVTAETIRAVLGPKTRAVIVVHLAGWPCEMDPILELAAACGLKVIEDCAQAHGARYKGRPVGSLGHAAAFSFCQDKIITTGGEGGMLTTRDETVWRRAWSYKDHGKHWQAASRPRPGGTFRWLHEDVGTNWRMTEMQAALGRVALRKLSSWVRTRRHHAALLNTRLRRLPALRVPQPPSHVQPSYYKYYAFVRPECLKPDWNRDRLVVELRAQGIPCGTGVCAELYREKVFARRGLGPDQSLPVAGQLGRTSLMFPVHPTLTARQVARMADAVEALVEKASRVPQPRRRAA